MAGTVGAGRASPAGLLQNLSTDEPQGSPLESWRTGDDLRGRQVQAKGVTTEQPGGLLGAAGLVPRRAGET